MNMNMGYKVVSIAGFWLLGVNYHLSVSGRQLLDRHSFQHFVGLMNNHDVPDQKMVWKYPPPSPNGASEATQPPTIWGPRRTSVRRHSQRDRSERGCGASDDDAPPPS